MMDMDELYRLKAAALLHDPPHKAWVVLGRRLLSGSGGSERAHERDALEFARLVVSGTGLEGAVEQLSGSVVERADWLAASQDRLLLEKSEKKEGGLKSWGFKGLANIFYPSIKHEFYAPSRNEVLAVARALNEILRKARDAKKAYHLLYAFLELVWGLYAKNKVGPADTRVPHHSIFDHLYATAAAVNWSLAGGNRYEGYIVHLDFPGIQGFISPARRLSDYWAGSWFVSLAMWYVVAEVVERYGPDVLVIPTARMNPFYYWYIYNNVLGGSLKGFDKELSGRLEGAFRSLLPDGWPMQPVIPGTATLMLPLVSPPSRGSWKEYFEERLRDFWKRAVLVSRKVWEEAFGDEVAAHLDLVLDDPPFQLVAKVKRVSFSVKEKDERLVYAREAFEVAQRGKSRFRVAMGVGVDWSSLTRVGEGGDAEKIYRMCSVCRSLPGVVRRTREGFQVWRRGEGYVGVTPREEELASILLKEGEALCPYCMVKRAFALRGSVKNLLKISFGSTKVEVKNFVFPSTGDVAALDFKLRLLKGLLKERGKAEKIVEELEAALREKFSEDSEELREWKRRREEAEKSKGLPYIPLKPLYEELEKTKAQNLLEDGALWVLVYALVVREAEPFILGSASRVVLSVLRKHGIIERGEGPSLYYAIVRADGDMIGDVIAGRLAFVGGTERYYEMLYKGVQGAPERFPVEMAERLRKLMETLQVGCVKVDRVIAPTPSYHFSLSRAMVAAALEDIDVVRRNGGFVVYAGGDDLAALLPVVLNREPAVLKAIVESRRRYWGVGPYPGFIVRHGTVVPALLGGGRSYGVRLSHYRDPMNWEIELAGELLEGVAKRVKEGEARKDAVAFGYGRGASSKALTQGEECSVDEEWVEVLPNWLSTASGEEALDVRYGRGLAGVSAYVEGAGKVWSLVNDGVLSKSFLYDVEGQRKFISSVAGEGSEYALKILLNLVKRNSREGGYSEAEKVLSGMAGTDMVFCNVWLPLRVLRAARFLMEGVRSSGGA